MAETPKAECVRVRESLLDRAMADRPVESLPDAMEDHLRACAACARHAEGLRSAPALFTRPPLYDNALRARTREAVESRAESRDRRVAWLAAPAAALTIFMSFAVPTWLLSIPLSSLVESDLLALALALFIVQAAGVIPAGFCTVLAMRRHAPGGDLEEVFNA